MAAFAGHSGKTLLVAINRPSGTGVTSSAEAFYKPQQFGTACVGQQPAREFRGLNMPPRIRPGSKQQAAALDDVMVRGALITCECQSGLKAACYCVVPIDGPADEGKNVFASAAVRDALLDLEQGNLNGAVEHCVSALQAAPVNTDALWLLHSLRLRVGQADAAISLLRRLIRIDCTHVPATLELAALLFGRDDLVEAEHHARNAVRLAPTHMRSHNILAMVLTEVQQLHAGEFHYRRVLELTGSRDPVLLANLAWNLKGQSRMEEARELFQESTAAAPEMFYTWLSWGQLEEADGCVRAAKEKFDRAAALDADAPELRIARGKLFVREGNFTAALAALDQPFPASVGAAVDPNALMERGRLLDRLGRYEEAFDHFDSGKRVAREILGRRYLAQEAADLSSRLKTFFVGHRLRLMPTNPVRHDVAQPIFILGFPRSGTTMVEQVLSNHPRIAAGDELPFVNDMTNDVSRLLSSSLNYPEALSELWIGDKARSLTILRDVYLEKAAVRELGTRDRPWFTDKMPLNEMHLGLVALVFPKSPLLHMIRHPLDVVLSAYSHHFTHGYFCAYELESIALHYRLVMELAEHYRAEMPLRYLPIHYEDLVDDVDTGVRRMLNFIGEEFDQRCVNFQDNRRRPRTPSYSQVAEKIYPRSRYRYCNYLKQLEPATEILQPIIARLGYKI